MAPQSYYLGGKIRSSDFNGFADDINEIVGLGAGDSGYGQNQLMVSYVAAGAKVRAANWDELLTSIKFAAQHQGTNINIPTTTTDAAWPAQTKIISIIPTLLSDISNVRSNKLNYDISKMSVDANKISSSRTYSEPGPDVTSDDTWVSTKTYEFTVSFASEDARRNFFNAGGEVRIECSLTPEDDTHVQSESWSQLLQNVGSVRFGHNETISSAYIGQPGNGFTGISDTEYLRVYRKGGTAGYYAGNQLNIYAKYNGTSAIDFKVEFYDAYPTGATDDPSTPNEDESQNDFVGNDFVAGTLLVTINQQRADDNDSSLLGVVSPSPTYSHISEL